MKQLLTAIAWAGLMISSAMAQETNRQITIALSEPGRPFGLEVSLVQGGIRVSEYAGKIILIHITGNGDASTLKVTQEHNAVEVHSERPGILTDLDIQVPRGIRALKLTAVNRGNIEVADLHATMEISNKNGPVKLLHVSGSALINTVNAPIQATFTAVDPDSPLAFASLNGNITVALPAGLNANARIRNAHGAITSGFTIVPETGKPDTPGSGKWLYGTIGKGGPELQINNSRGSITIVPDK